MAVLNLLLVVLALVVAVPVLVLLVQAAAAVLWGRRVATGLPGKTRANSDATVAVLIPAHNEGAGLLPTLGDLRPQLGPRDRILVVADNCSDDTAEQAAAAGAEVIQRHDTANRGKGFALDFGLRHLALAPPDILVMCDADCRIAAGAIAQLAAACVEKRRPAQALYLMEQPPGAGRGAAVSQWAWRIRNWTRPLGMAVFGLPCQLTGTGMAFPWSVTGQMRLASAALAEDLELGISLAQSGSAPILVPAALVTSEFASTTSGEDTQKERWQRGHLQAIRTGTPRLLAAALRRRDPSLAAMALDVAVPPVVMLTGLVSGTLALCALFAILSGSATPLVISAVTMAALVSALGLAWWHSGRDILPPGVLAGALLRFGTKAFPFAGRLLSRRSTAGWVRTDRTRPGE